MKCSNHVQVEGSSPAKLEVNDFIKQKIVVEIETVTQFATAEKMVRELLKFPAILSVNVLSCTGPKPYQIDAT